MRYNRFAVVCAAAAALPVAGALQIPAERNGQIVFVDDVTTPPNAPLRWPTDKSTTTVMVVADSAAPAGSDDTAISTAASAPSLASSREFAADSPSEAAAKSTPMPDPSTLATAAAKKPALEGSMLGLLVFTIVGLCLL